MGDLPVFGTTPPNSTVHSRSQVVIFSSPFRDPNIWLILYVMPSLGLLIVSGAVFGEQATGLSMCAFWSSRDGKPSPHLWHGKRMK